KAAAQARGNHRGGDRPERRGDILAEGKDREGSEHRDEEVRTRLLRADEEGHRARQTDRERLRPARGLCVDCRLRVLALPSAGKEALKKRNLDPASIGGLSGLACKYCQAAAGGEEYCHKGQYFPCNFVGLSDSSFPQSLTQHVRSCPNVPVEVRCALDELTRLTAEYKVTTKRGSKKKFLKKIWSRMQNHYN
ncbi:hypothetical protein THAOC_13649, partial [Thalassiosira oceanica]